MKVLLVASQILIVVECALQFVQVEYGLNKTNDALALFRICFDSMCSKWLHVAPTC